MSHKFRIFNEGISGKYETHSNLKLEFESGLTEDTASAYPNYQKMERFFQECSTKNAHIMIGLDRRNQLKIQWLSGTWVSGVLEFDDWLGGVFMNGTIEFTKWHDGVFKKGVTHAIEWLNGVWENGKFMDGVWHDGVWRNGTFYAGKWKDGIWEKGVFGSKSNKYATWEKGKILVAGKYIDSNTPPTA